MGSVNESWAELDDQFMAMIEYKEAQFQEKDDYDDEDGDGDSTGSTNSDLLEEEPDDLENLQIGQQDQIEDKKAEVDEGKLVGNQVDVYTGVEKQEEVKVFHKSTTHPLPKPADVQYEMTCGVCAEYSGPPQFACFAGHSICAQCFESGMTSCQTKIDTSEDPEQENVYDCEADVFKIPDILKKTGFYKYFAEEALYTCGAWDLGCDKISLKETELAKHELEECKFR